MHTITSVVPPWTIYNTYVLFSLSQRHAWWNSIFHMQMTTAKYVINMSILFFQIDPLLIDLMGFIYLILIIPQGDRSTNTWSVHNGEIKKTKWTQTDQKKKKKKKKKNGGKNKNPPKGEKLVKLSQHNYKKKKKKKQ